MGFKKKYRKKLSIKKLVQKNFENVKKTNRRKTREKNEMRQKKILPFRFKPAINFH